MPDTLFSLTGKRALVTGASSGLGAHFAAVLAQAGASVVLTARREESVANVARGITQSGGDARTVALDVTDNTSLGALEPMVADIDILVNNAGVVRDGFALDQSEDDWDIVIGTN